MVSNDYFLIFRCFDHMMQIFPPCMMLQCHGWGWKPPLTASHIHIGCIQSVLWFSTLRCCGWAYYRCINSCITCAGGEGGLGKMGYGQASMMLGCHDWGFKPPLIASHIHIGYTKSFSTLRCCGWAYGCILMHCNTCAGGDECQGKWGMA